MYAKKLIDGPHIQMFAKKPRQTMFFLFSPVLKKVILTTTMIKKSLFLPGRKVYSTKTVFKKNITIAITESKIVNAKTSTNHK